MHVHGHNSVTQEDSLKQGLHVYVRDYLLAGKVSSIMHTLIEHWLAMSCWLSNSQWTMISCWVIVTGKIKIRSYLRELERWTSRRNLSYSLTVSGGEEAPLGWGVENWHYYVALVIYTLLQNRDNSGLLGTPEYCSLKLGGGGQGWPPPCPPV